MMEHYFEDVFYCIYEALREAKRRGHTKMSIDKLLDLFKFYRVKAKEFGSYDEELLED